MLEIDATLQIGAHQADVQLTVQPGEAVGLWGPNGSGKTTIMRHVSGLAGVLDGRIANAGQVWDEPGSRTFVEATGRSVGYIFQELRLFDWQSVTDHLQLVASWRQQSVEDGVPMDELIEAFDLGDIASQTIGTLSGGQQARVGIARSFIAAPSVVLLDEPFASLDESTRSQVANQLQQYICRFNCPALLVSHDRDDHVAMSARVVNMTDVVSTPVGA